jgi:hypothetical protein
MRYFAIAASFAFAITAMLASGSAKAENIMSDGKCWINNQQTYYHWGDCPKEHPKHHAKGHAKHAEHHAKGHDKGHAKVAKDHAKGDAKPKKG